MSDTPAHVAAVAAEPNPLTRARLAGELIARLQTAVTVMKPIRAAAIEELVAEHGWNDSQLASYLGITRSRVGQIRRAGRTAEAPCKPPASSPPGSC